MEIQDLNWILFLNYANPAQECQGLILSQLPYLIKKYNIIIFQLILNSKGILSMREGPHFKKLLIFLALMKMIVTNYLSTTVFDAFTSFSKQYFGVENFTYDHFPTRSASWYTEYGNVFEVRTTNGFTQVMDLIPAAEQFTCQAFDTTTENKMMNLYFHYFIDQNIDSSILIVKVDNVEISRIIVTNKEPLLFQKNFNLSLLTQHEVCFGGKHRNLTQILPIGVLVDNITLEDMVVLVTEVNGKGEYYPIINYIAFVTDLIWPPDLSLELFYNESTLAVDQQNISKADYEFYLHPEGNLSFKAVFVQKAVSPQIATMNFSTAAQGKNFGEAIIFSFNRFSITTFANVTFEATFAFSSPLNATATTTLQMHKNWEIQLPNLFKVLVNGSQVQIFSKSVKTELDNSAKFMFLLKQPIKKPAYIQISILNNTLVNNKSQFTTFTTTPFLYEEDKYEKTNESQQQKTELQKNLYKVSQKCLETISNSKKMFGVVGSNYLISNLISFFSLTFVFHFLPFRSILGKYADILNDPMKVSMMESPLSNQINKISFFKKLLEKDELKGEQLPINKFYASVPITEFGMTSRFWSNTEQSILALLLVMIKIGLIRLMCRIPIHIIQHYSNRAKKMEIELFLFELIAASPGIVLPFSSLFSYRSKISAFSFSDHLNIVAHVGLTYFCFTFIFLLLIVEFSKESKKYPKQSNNNNNINSPELKQQKQHHIKQLKQKNDELQRKLKIKKVPLIVIKKFKQEDTERTLHRKYSITQQQRAVIINLLENSMYFLLPMVAGQFSTAAYTLTVLLVVILRLFLLIKWRASFSKWEFVKNMANRVIWILYCNVYVAYFAIDTFDLNFTQLLTLKIVKFCGSAEVIIFMIGIAYEIFIILIQLFINIYSMFVAIQRKCCNNAIKHMAAEEGKKQNISVEVIDSIPNLMENQKSTLTVVKKQRMIERKSKFNAETNSQIKINYFN